MRSLLPTIVMLALAAGCSTAPDADLPARMADLEGRVADVEAAIAQPATSQPVAPAQGTPQQAAPEDEGQEAIPEKDEFVSAATDTAVKREAGLDDAEVSFVDDTDTLVVRAPSAQDGDLDRAWDAAQRLADLWEDLDTFQPVLDLKVGEVRCACSAKLMTDIAEGAADRATWETACA